MGRQPHARLILIHCQLIKGNAQQLLQPAGDPLRKRRQQLNGVSQVHIPRLHHKSIMNAPPLLEQYAINL